MIKHSAQVKVDKSVHCTLLSTFTWCQQPRQPLLLFFFGVITCFNKQVPRWYLHRQRTYHSNCIHTNTMQCICMSTIWMQRSEGNAHTSLHIHPVNCLYSVQGQKNRIKILTLLTHFPSLSLFFLFVCCHIRWIRLNCFSAPTLYIALSDPLSNSNLNSQNPLSNNIDFEIKLLFYFLF